MKINLGYLISYDYEMLMTSLIEVYDHVDRIFLAIDENRKTWSGNSFEIPENFFSGIEKFDKKNKIHFYFDNFFEPGLTPAECDTRERNMLLKKMGHGWKIQLDVDEFIYDFKQVTDFLRRHWYLTLFPKFTPIVFRGKWVTLIKKLPDGFLYVNNGEKFPFITNLNNYEYMRENRSVRNHFLNINAIHQSWARAENEIETKLFNWSHRNDFNIEEYLTFWKELSSSNYEQHENLHPIYPEVWPKLFFLPANSIQEFILKFSSTHPQKLKGLKKGLVLKELKRSLYIRTLGKLKVIMS